MKNYFRVRAVVQWVKNPSSSDHRGGLRLIPGPEQWLKGSGVGAAFKNKQINLLTHNNRLVEKAREKPDPQQI